MSIRNVFIAFSLVATVVTMAGCAGESLQPTEYAISGVVQKGPFVTGTEVQARELDSALEQTGRVVTGTISDNAGSFSVRGSFASPFVALSATGFYFNETTGALSPAQVTLTSISDLRDRTTINVNILTHLESARVPFLVDSGVTFSDAKAQARQEILAVFGVDAQAEGVTSFEELDISEPGAGNAILLAISAILLEGRSEAQVTEFLAQIVDDLRADGQLDSSTLLQSLKESARNLDLEAVRANVTQRYAELGQTILPPDFESYVLAFSPNSAPEVVSFVHAPSPALVGSPTAFSWMLQDRDGDTLVCNFDPGDGSTIQRVDPCGDGTAHTYSALGTFTSTLTVDDGETQTSATTTVSVQGQIRVDQFGTAENDFAFAVATDGLGNTYVAGATDGSLEATNAGANDVYVLKFDAGGNKIWGYQFGEWDIDQARAIEVDGTGRVFVAGTISGWDAESNPKYEAFLMMLDTDGTRLWLTRFGGGFNDYVSDIVLTPDGHVVVAGEQGDRITGDQDGYLTKFDLAGNLIWSRPYGTASNDSLRGVGVDSSGNLYAVGDTQGDIGGANFGASDIFVMKVDPDGNELWTRQVGTPVMDLGFGGLAMRGDDRIVVSGFTDGDLYGANAGRDDVVVMAFDASGNIVWAQQFGSSEIDQLNDLAVSSTGEVYGVGVTAGDFGGTFAGGYTDAFVLKLDVGGEVSWVQQFGTAEDEGANGMSIDANGNLKIAGTTSGVLGSSSEGFFDAYLSTYAP